MPVQSFYGSVILARVTLRTRRASLREEGLRSLSLPVRITGSGEVLQQTHGHAGAPGAMFIEEEPVSRHHVHHTPCISLHRAVLFIVYYRQCALVHLNIVAGDDAAGVLDHRLFPEWCPQAATSYGQEPIRNLCPGVLPLPPEVLVLWNAFLFQQGLDCCPFLPGLALDLFDLFACKHVSLY